MFIYKFDYIRKMVYNQAKDKQKHRFPQIGFLISEYSSRARIANPRSPNNLQCVLILFHLTLQSHPKANHTSPTASPPSPSTVPQDPAPSPL